MWHHICVTWKNTKGDWQFYLDGQLQSSGTDLKKNHQIPAGGTVVIGQDQDKVGGDFDIEDSFGPGEVKEVNLWSRVLSGMKLQLRRQIVTSHKQASFSRGDSSKETLLV